MANIQSVTRLRKLGAVFSVPDVCRIHGMSLEEARVYVARWTKYEFVKQAGPRLSHYYNLIAVPEWRKMIPTAIAKIFPSAVVIGPSVLHNHGWTTQIPQEIHIAVSAKETVPNMDGVAIFRRPESWFSRMAPFGQEIYGLRALTPEKALSDAQRYGRRQGMWVPDPDDLDIPDDSPMAGKSRRSSKASRPVLSLDL